MSASTMKCGLILLALSLTAVLSINAETSPKTHRDEAVKKIDACLKRNEVSSHQCKKLNQNIQVLVDVYRAGDKSVLPTLLKFTYLSEFYDEALLSDPEGFLSAVKQLPDEQRREVAIGISGGYFKPISKAQFAALRNLLVNIPESSPTKGIAQICLKQLETNNASLFLDYFPPQTFTSPAASFQTYWYSRDLFALGQRPLWPPSPSATVFRFTYLGAFTGPKCVMLTVLPDGSGTVSMKALNPSHDQLSIDESKAASAEQVSRFFDALKKANYWNAAAEVPSRGLDGAEWIIEGVRDGQYRIVLRWCPGVESHAPETLAFADAARLLFEFAGHKYKGGC